MSNRFENNSWKEGHRQMLAARCNMTVFGNSQAHGGLSPLWTAGLASSTVDKASGDPPTILQ